MNPHTRTTPTARPEEERNAEPGSRADRQRTHWRADRRQRHDRLGMLSALRRRSRVLRAARQRRAARCARPLVDRTGRRRDRNAVVHGEHGGTGDAPDRQRRRRRGDHRLRAALRPSRPVAPADDDRAPRQAAGRQPARGRPAAPRLPVRARAAGDDHRQPSCALRWPGPHVAAVDRRVADGHPRGARLLHRGHVDAARRRRDDPRATGQSRPPLPRGHARPLARVGARTRHPVRMAGGGDPGRHHAQAQCVRRHGRDHRGDDDVRSRSRRFRPQLGLSVLLAARRLLRRECAEPARRDDDDGALPAVPDRHRGRHQRRADPARLSRERQRRVARTRGGRAARLPRHGAGARRQRRVAADPSTTSTARRSSPPRTCSSTSG